MAATGLAAPPGSLWARGSRPGATWHLLRAAELPPPGAPLRYRSVRSVCGLFASLLPEADGWAEVTERAGVTGPIGVCRSCLASVADVQRALRLAAQAPPEQKRLF